MYDLLMTRHRASVTGLALTIAAALGVVVGAMSQLAAVDVADPRPSVPPSFAPTPTSSPSPSPTPESSPSPTPSPTPEPEEGEVWLHTVAEGDSLSGLAIRFGTTTDEILILNPEYAANEDLVEVGSVVILPCTPIAAAEARC